jgi:hypothetical protein
VITGFQNAGRTLVSAFTGLVTDPINESRKTKYKSKVAGAFVGLGKGLSGVVVKPVQGIIGAGTGIVTGIRKSVEGDAVVLHRERPARAFPRRQIIPYNDTYARLQLICLANDPKGMIENVYQHATRPVQAVLSSGYFWIIGRAGVVETNVAFKAVRSCALQGCRVVMATTAGSIAFQCTAPGAAAELTRRVYSRCFAAQIGIDWI